MMSWRIAESVATISSFIASGWGWLEIHAQHDRRNSRRALQKSSNDVDAEA